jgi:molybdopterin synthase sulfur carrier subunit
VIRVVVPAPLRVLARLDGEIRLELAGPVTPQTILDALEARHPALLGTIRDRVTHERRAFVRYFACGEDLSHEGRDVALPAAVVSGAEPFIILGAMSGG